MDDVTPARQTPVAEESPPAAAGSPAAATFHRLRVRFGKQGDLRLISHRDLARLLERLFRRAGVEVCQSEGFHPKPRMMFPSALALGIVGLDEVLEVDLADSVEPSALVETLSAHAPPGLTFLSAERVPQGARKAQIKSLTFELPLPPENIAEVAAGAQRLMAAAAWPLERGERRSAIDVRANLAELIVEQGTLRMKLRASRMAAAGPRDILEALAVQKGDSEEHLVRTHVELA